MVGFHIFNHMVSSANNCHYIYIVSSHPCSGHSGSKNIWGRGETIDGDKDHPYLVYAVYRSCGTLLGYNQ